MKATLEFNLPEDQSEFDVAIKGGDWRNLVWNMDQYLRKQVKYNESLTPEQRDVYQQVRDELNGMLNQSNLDLD